MWWRRNTPRLTWCQYEQSIDCARADELRRGVVLDVSKLCKWSGEVKEGEGSGRVVAQRSEIQRPGSRGPGLHQFRLKPEPTSKGPTEVGPHIYQCRICVAAASVSKVVSQLPRSRMTPVVGFFRITRVGNTSGSASTSGSSRVTS